MAVAISGAVEGLVDEAVARRLIAQVGATPGPVYGRNGKEFLRQRLGGYNLASQHSPWIVIVDLNHEVGCAPDLRLQWLPAPARFMCFRVAVRETEAWLLADRERVAKFLGVAIAKVPRDPEALDDPKQTLVNLASRSRRRAIREDMVARPGSRRAVGPAYTSRLIEFATDPSAGWRPTVAAANSDSLASCLVRLGELSQGRN